MCEGKQNVKDENSMYTLDKNMNHKSIHYVDSKIHNTNRPKTTRSENADNNILAVAL